MSQNNTQLNFKSIIFYIIFYTVTLLYFNILSQIEIAMMYDTRFFRKISYMHKIQNSIDSN